MARIATITMNPAIDLATAVELVVPTIKLRCRGLQRDPGGGGINVARVIRRMGSPVTAIYTAGGAIGRLLQTLVEQEKVESIAVGVSAETREDFTVSEETSNQQFRFVLEGPELNAVEWQACLSALRALEPFPQFLVASGSLPPGVPNDFYGQIARLAKTQRAKLVLDTSGSLLREALAQGVFLVKPNLNELCALIGRPLDADRDLIEACRKIVDAGQAEVVALTLGHRGALFISLGGVWRAPAVSVNPVSAVGAGDSFIGGITWSLDEGHPVESAFCYGMAAGAAALLSPGTELCHPDDVHRLFEKVELTKICKI